MRFRILIFLLIVLLASEAQSADLDRDAVWLNMLGNTAMNDGRYQDALAYFQKAVEVSRKANDMEGICVNLGNVGQVYYKLGQLEKALPYYEEALAMTRQHLTSKTHLAAALIGSARLYAEIGQEEKAISYLEEALNIKGLNAPNQLAPILNLVGTVYHQIGQYDKALAYLEEALKIWRSLFKPSGIVNSLQAIGVTYVSRYQPEKGLSYLEEALKIAKESGLSKSIPSVLANLGAAYSSLGQDEKALTRYEEAMKILKESNDPGDTAILLNNMGHSYSLLGQYSKALPALQDGLKIRREMKYPLGIGASLTELGTVHASLGQYEKALACLEESITIFRQLGRQSMLARDLNRIGEIYQALGQYEEARAYFGEAFELCRKTRDIKNLMTTFDMLGSVFYAEGRFDDAIVYYQNLIEFRRVDWDTEKTGHIEWLNRVGTAQLAKKDLKSAEEMFQQSEKVAQDNNLNLTANTGLVEVYISTGRFDDALTLLNKRPLQWSTPDPARMQFHTQKGLVLKNKGLLSEASYEFLDAVSISEDLRQQVKERSSFFGSGEYGGRIRPYRTLIAALSERALKPYLGGRIYFPLGIVAVGIAVVLAGRKRMGVALILIGAVGAATIVTLHLAAPRKSNENAPPYKSDRRFSAFGKDLASNAFYFSEATKARTLLETMADASKQYNKPELTTEIREKEQDIVNQLSASNDRWEEAYRNGEEGFHALVERRENLKAALRSLVATIRRDFPRYAALNYPGPIPPEELPLRDDEVLIEYAISSDATYLFIVTKGGVEKTIKIEMGKEELERLVSDFVLPLQSQDTKDEFSAALGQRLYDLLLKDALEAVSTDKKIIIVPDGILGLLPFEALVIKPEANLKDTTFVGDRWKMTYYQSATLLALTRVLQPSTAGRALFALGNPVYDKEDPRYAAYKQGSLNQPLLAENRERYAFRGLATRREYGKTGKDDEEGPEVVFLPLPETENEVRTIASLFGVNAEPPDVLLGVPASETGFRRAPLKDYHMLHFATHADLPGKLQGINEPFLLLGQVENEAKDDGFLTVTEVLDLSLDADMVVLSACVTGRGKAMEGEGIVNFARAFHHAGARSVVVSLWEVASNETVEYMESLYRRLKEGKSRAEAMLLARNEMKAKQPNPFFWAPFILHGEG